MTERILVGRPGREAIRDKISTVEDLDGVKRLLNDLVHAVRFRNDDEDANGQQKIRLGGNGPIDAGTFVRNRTPLAPLVGFGDSSGAEFGPVSGGMINQSLFGSLIPPEDSPGTGPTQPAIVPILRGFPNYAFNPTEGHTTLNDPVYGNVIPQQELLFQVTIGDKVKYGRISLLDNPDEGVPRPLIGSTNPPAQQSPVSVYGAGTTYAAGARVINSTSEGRLYMSLQGNNVGHALTDPAWWLEKGSGAVLNELIARVNTVLSDAGVLTQMHNDLAQSILAMGLFRPVPRESDKINWRDGPGPY